MTAQPAATRRGPLLAILLLVVLAVAAGGLWYLFLRPSGPAPVSLGSAAPTEAAQESAVAQATEVPGEATPAPDGSAAAGDGIAGTWVVDGSIGSFEDFSGSFVGYRVQETLATIGATEAVGRTPDVTGTLTVDGTTITGAEFTADLTGLESDDSRRDGQLRQQALETSQFPTATFILTSPIELGSAPAEGATIEVTATGDLTLHGVTRSVELPLQARLQAGVVTIAGSLGIAFADYDIDRPQSMMVLSVEDSGVMELQLQLARG